MPQAEDQYHFHESIRQRAEHQVEACPVERDQSGMLQATEGEGNGIGIGIVGANSAIQAAGSVSSANR